MIRNLGVFGRALGWVGFAYYLVDDLPFGFVILDVGLSVVSLLVCGICFFLILELK